MPSLKYRVFSGFVKLLPLKFWLKLFFAIRMKRLADLNEPRTFNEKIMYRKFNGRNDVFSRMADKIEAKKIVKKLNEKISVPRSFWEGNDFSSLDLNDLPTKFVFKANHASGTNLIVLNREDVSIEQLMKLRDEWFRHEQHHTMGEWAYKNIKKKVFIEEYLDFSGTSPDDYKFFVYHGRVRFIQLDRGRFSYHTRNMYDRKWNDLGISYSHPKGDDITKPKFIEDMIEIAESISMSLDFVRVDLYYHEGKIWFGEYTIYPGGGYERFPSLEIDLLFGEYW